MTHLMTDKEVMEAYGRSKDKILEDEKLHSAMMFQQMREWFRDPANKNASVEDANKARQNFERPWVMSAVAGIAKKKPRRRPAKKAGVKKKPKEEGDSGAAQ